MVTHTIKTAFILNFFKLYNMLWRVCLPFLRKNRRLARGFEKRVSTSHLPWADIWIQAASAGEAYLAVSIIKHLRLDTPTRVLATSMTSQGLDILKQNLPQEVWPDNIDLVIDWFLFDCPPVMEQAVKTINPKIMILLETEIWPALLYFLKKNKTRILILNGRLSKKSFQAYMGTKVLWQQLAPDLILATSDQDKKRYARVFETALVDTMPNIKFELHDTTWEDKAGLKKIKKILPLDLPLTVLASIRRQEEQIAGSMISSLLDSYPNQIIAVFPRHMHRIQAWKKRLKKMSIPYRLRSDLSSMTAEPANKPGIILWDTFGELKNIYAAAHSVFVGGSLKPLGGQNFIEPAMEGAFTVTGPYYDDFAWAGKQIFNENIVIKEKTAKAVTRSLLNALENPGSRSHRKQKTSAYLEASQGGTRQACKAVTDSLESIASAPFTDK